MSLCPKNNFGYPNSFDPFRRYGFPYPYDTDSSQFSEKLSEETKSLKLDDNEIKFKKINMNPLYLRHQDDCAVQALSLMSGKKWIDVYKDLCNESFKYPGFTYNSINIIEKVAKSYGFNIMSRFKRGSIEISVIDIISLLKHEPHYILIAEDHAVLYKNYTIIDQSGFVEKFMRSRVLSLIYDTKETVNFNTKYAIRKFRRKLFSDKNNMKYF